jgi:hypothetical protein
MILTVYDNNNNKLFTGTKQDCMHFIKRKNLNRTQIKISSDKPTPKVPECTYATTAPVTPQPEGFFKRIFKK